MVIDLLADLGGAFILGLLTPLGAVCVLPLYPAFIAYLSSHLSKKKSPSKKVTILLGLSVSAGAVIFMMLFGLIFTTIFQVSLTNVIGVISPIAFFILLLIGILLVTNFDMSQYLPKAHVPKSKNPIVNAFLFGFGFGAIILPCNPLFIAALLARSALDSTGDAVLNILRFIFFGLGIGAPLIALSVLSASKSSFIINFFTNQRRKINMIVGMFMIIVSLYYLLCVFSVLGDFPGVSAVCRPLSLVFSWFATLV